MAIEYMTTQELVDELCCRFDACVIIGCRDQTAAEKIESGEEGQQVYYKKSGAFIDTLGLVSYAYKSESP